MKEWLEVITNDSQTASRQKRYQPVALESRRQELPLFEARVGVRTTVVSDDNFLRIGALSMRCMRGVVGAKGGGSAMLARLSHKF